MGGPSGSPSKNPDEWLTSFPKPLKVYMPDGEAVNAPCVEPFVHMTRVEEARRPTGKRSRHKR